MRAEIERLRNEHATLRADIRKRYPEYAELIDPRAAGIGDVRKALGPGEALVSIYLGESQSYVWTIAPDGRIAFRVVPATRAEVESDVRELRKAVDFVGGNPNRLPAFDFNRAHRLYRTFFETDEALWKDAQVLNVIPHGALGQLPMGLLVTAPTQAAPADMPWLIRKVAIAQLPSARAFTALRRAGAGKTGRQPFIGFGDPVFAAGAGNNTAGAVRNLVIGKVADTTEEELDAALRGTAIKRAADIASAPTLSRAFSLLSALPDTSVELKEIATALKAGQPSCRGLRDSRHCTRRNHRT
jgi:CHAT domain-containing protein